MKRLLALVLSVILCTVTVYAEVITTDKTEGYSDYIYVAGDPDNYPIEYYDEESKSYMGVIPDLLNEISLLSGLDFVYINGNLADKEELGDNLQVDIVSSSSSEGSYQKEYLEFIALEKNEEILSYGIAFTKIASSERIALIKEALDEISLAKRNGIYLSYASKSGIPIKKAIGGFILVALALVTTVTLLALSIKRIKKANEADKMIDIETGLGNLQSFKYHFDRVISDKSRELYHVAYLALDSEYLKSYYGEGYFQDALRYTASILSSYSGDAEFSARISENGFAIAYQALNNDDSHARLEEMMNRLSSLDDVNVSTGKLIFYASVYHLLPSDRNCDTLIFNLQKNCNKIFGTDQKMIYCNAYDMSLAQEEKKTVESILKGFDSNEFKMYLQFVVDNKTKNVVSAEALSRWDSNEKGLISPNKYIPSMEKYGLISKHDFNMFELTCRQLEKWRGTGFESIPISCNFTRITLSEADFMDKLKSISDKYDFDRSNLAIEITEDAIEKDRKTATENVTRCKELGFKVYLDDLGSGYTSLANLCDYPIDVVKIDRDILLKTGTKLGKDLFSGIIALAHSLNTKVICEGVETEEQVKFVSKTDCDYVQGWYYSKPIPLEECRSFLENRYKG